MYWQDFVADTLSVHLHKFNQYVWAKANPGQHPPQQEVTLYSEVAHRDNRRKRATDNMTAGQIKAYISAKL